MRVLLLLLCATTALPTVAAACSCVGFGPQRTVLPAADTRDVPINAHVHVFASGFLPGIRARLHEEYRLFGPDGPVAFSAKVTRTRIDLIPQKPLAPRTTYRIEQLFAYGLDGALIDDTQRTRLLWDGGWAALRYWYPLQTFTTGPQPAQAPPTPVIKTADAHFPRGGGDCGPGVALWAEVAPQSAPHLVAELEVEGYGVVSTRAVPVDRPFAIRVSDLNCTPDKFSLRAKGPFIVKVAFVGPGGRRAVSAPVTVNGFGRSRNHVDPDKPGWTALWFKGTVKPTPVTPAVGPSACPNGIEVVRSTAVTSVGGPTAYDARNALVRVGSTMQALAVQDERIQRLGPNTRHTVIEGDTVRSTPTQSGTAAIVVDHADRHSTLTALGFDAQGAVQWRTPIATQDLNWRPRVVACKGTVAAAWAKVIDQQYGATKIWWVLLDAKTGAVRRRASEGLAIEGEGAALSCGGDDGIWLVGRARMGRELHAVRIDAKTPKATTIKGLRASTVAAAPAADGLVVLGDGDGVRAVQVNASGQASGGVFQLSRTGRKPVVAPLQNGVFVAAWERPGTRTFATAFDLKGHVAHPRPIGGDWITPTLRVDGDRITLGITEDEHDAANKAVRVARLRCAARPMSGPPPRLK